MRGIHRNWEHQRMEMMMTWDCKNMKMGKIWKNLWENIFFSRYLRFQGFWRPQIYIYIIIYIYSFIFHWKVHCYPISACTLRPSFISAFSCLPAASPAALSRSSCSRSAPGFQWFSGWWLSHPWKKYENQLGWWNSQYVIWTNKKRFQTTKHFFTCFYYHKPSKMGVCLPICPPIRGLEDTGCFTTVSSSHGVGTERHCQNAGPKSLFLTHLTPNREKW